MEKCKPYTVLTEDGIWHYPIKADGSDWLAPIRLCDPFEVIGTGCDIAGQYYHVIEHQGEQCLIARGDVGTNEGWRLLRNLMNIPSARKKLDLLTEYIQESQSIEPWEITDTAGWHKDAYILPNGEIVGKAEQIYFDGKISNAKRRAYGSKGSLNHWKSQIGKYADGNSRLCLLLGAAFAAPLMQHLGIDGGILHLYGASSSGKTTAQRVAQSVWGHGAATTESWNTTAFALTNNAAARNDGLLSMDEISEDGNGLGVDHSIYALSNGKGRAQGNKDGGNRPEIHFRTLCSSTGEVSLESHLLMHGKQVKAGQLVRCPSIPHQLENKHDFADFRAFTNHLNLAVAEYYGTAGRIFIEQLCADKAHWLKVAQECFNQHHQQLAVDFALNAQHTRTARLFAAAMAGIELACKFGILSLNSEATAQGVYKCFSDWLTPIQERSNGQGKSYEENAIEQAARDYMTRHRFDFVDIEQPYQPSSHFSGYTKKFPDKDDEYYVFSSIFKEEICKGFDEEIVKAVLYDLGWLQKEQEKRWQFQLYAKLGKSIKSERLGRFYKFSGISPKN